MLGQRVAKPQQRFAQLLMAVSVVFVNLKSIGMGPLGRCSERSKGRRLTWSPQLLSTGGARENPLLKCYRKLHVGNVGALAGPQTASFLLWGVSFSQPCWCCSPVLQLSLESSSRDLTASRSPLAGKHVLHGGSLAPTRAEATSC